MVGRRHKQGKHLSAFVGSMKEISRRIVGCGIVRKRSCRTAKTKSVMKDAKIRCFTKKTSARAHCIRESKIRPVEEGQLAPQNKEKRGTT